MDCLNILLKDSENVMYLKWNASGRNAHDIHEL